MYSTLDVQLSGDARALLRAVRLAGGTMLIEHEQLELAKTCAANGLVMFGTIGGPGYKTGLALTGKAYAYLDRIMRAH